MSQSSGVYVHRSNRSEILVDVLAELAAEPAGSVLQPECIVVQGRGMERWLSMQLARRLGVWANPDFPFPRSLFERAFRAVLGSDDLAHSSPLGADATVFAPEALVWGVAKLLPQLCSEPAFTPIRHYLGPSGDLRKRLQLARRIAAVFDRYIVYRPQLVLEWEAGRHTDWQALLWRGLVSLGTPVQPNPALTSPAATGHRIGSSKPVGPPLHAAALEAAFHTEVGRTEGPIVGLPPRVLLFGISALPPSYMRMLSSLSRRIPIHLFVLSPSREYWADIRSRRETARRRARQPLASAQLELNFDSRLLDSGPGTFPQEEAPATPTGSQPGADQEIVGHPLLASLGRLQRDFQQVLEQTSDYHESETDLYCDPLIAGECGEIGAQTPTMLTVLQSDILALRHRHVDNPDAPPLALTRDDNSIAVHACHGPTRELEVLHDQLRALLETDPSLTPQDIVVMTPDIEPYAALVDAVFGAVDDPQLRIPYRVADRPLRKTQNVAVALDAVLDLLQGRLAAPDVFDLLTLDLVRQAVGLRSHDIATLRTWVAESGVRWGEDAAHRCEVDQPGRHENTWRFGLERLFLGYALPPEDDALYGGVLPMEGIEGTEAQLLGPLADFCEIVFELRDLFAQCHPVSTWKRLFQRLMQRLIAASPENIAQHQQLLDALSRLELGAAISAFDEAIPLAAIRPLLLTELERGGSSQGFLSGGVTFCQLMPMRSIPFRVVCLMGMNDGAFPRSPQTPAFDRVANQPRIGDRSPRDDDRYLMLEALLSARDHLLITYVGQDMNGSGQMPPSVLVGELLDCLEESFVMTTDTAPGAASAPCTHDIRRRIVLKHPLQPFSPRYFDGSHPQLFSYSRLHFHGARTLCQPRQARRPFLSQPVLSDSPVEAGFGSTVSLHELERFFRLPARTLLETRLGLFLEEERDPLQGREPLEMAGLERWDVGSQLLQRALNGEDLLQAWKVTQAAGKLPLGAVGRHAYGHLSHTAERAGRLWSQWTDSPSHSPIDVDIAVGSTRLVGTLDNLWPRARVCVRFSRLEGPWELSVWLQHLLLCAYRQQSGSPVELPCHTVAIGCADGDAQAARFDPVAEASARLAELVQLYHIGQQVPLPFFPRAARAYQTASKGATPGSAEERTALTRAQGLFCADASVSGIAGEANDPYVQQAFGPFAPQSHPLAPSYRPCAVVPAGYPDFATAARRVFSPLLDHRCPIAS